MLGRENSNRSFLSHQHAIKKNDKNAPHMRFFAKQRSKLEVDK